MKGIVPLCLFSLAVWAVDPPQTRKDNFREVLHGVEIIDPYRWLEDNDSLETRRWIEAQNAHARSVIQPLSMREPIAARLRQLMDAPPVGAPVVRNGVYYFAKRERGKELWSLWRRAGLKGRDELLVDPAAMSSDNRTSVASMGVSHNGRVYAYAVRRGGEDESEIRFLDLETRRDLPTTIPRHLNRGFALSDDGARVFYTNHHRDKGPRIHELDLRSGRDVEIFGEGYGPDKFLSPMLAGDRNLILTVSHGWARTELLLKRPDAPVVHMTRGIDTLFWPVVAGPDRLLIQTDWKAPKRRVLAVDLKNPDARNWTEIVPEADDAIQSITVAGDRLFVRYLHNVTTRIRTFTLAGKPAGEVDLPGLGSATISGNWRDPEAVLAHSSFNRPVEIYVQDARTGERHLFHKPPVPFESDRFAVRQVWYRSKDGTRVPMFVVHRKDLKPDGNLPVLLSGYGGFNVSITPSFSYSRAVWLEQGGVYAVANLRGGAEFGEPWHRAGMLERKQNVFDDFIAAAEWLIANRYTNPSRLAIEGTSNGGLLVGAALTQRPDLFRAVLCRYPDLDMVGYYRFKNNNRPALAEYGDASKPEHFKFLCAYSPYQRVKDGTKYPAVLLTTGDADTRVPPLQARKMAARLQAATASGLPVLLLYDTLSGHAGAPPQGKIIEDASLELSFLMSQLRMTWR